MFKPNVETGQLREVLTCRGDQLNRFYCTCPAVKSKLVLNKVLTCRGNQLNKFIAKLACPVVMSKLVLNNQND